MVLSLKAPVAALKRGVGLNRRTGGSSSLRAAKTRTCGFLPPRRQHGLSTSTTSSRSGGAIGFFTVATAGVKNGDVHGDKRGYKNGHAKSDQHSPTTTKGVAADRGVETPTGGDAVTEGLFASLDDGIVDASDRGMSFSASSDVVPDVLLLPNPATMAGSPGSRKEGEGGEGDDSRDAGRHKATSASSTGNIAAEFNVGDETRWPVFSETSWEFNESTAMARGAMGPLVAPPWRVMLLSDGSVTRHLQLLTDAKIKVEVLRHNVVSPADIVDDQSIPADVLKKLIPHQQQRLDEDDDEEHGASECDAEECDVSDFEPPTSCGVSQAILHREVDLCRSTDDVPMVYASSWWTVEAAKKFNILKTDGGATERAVWMHLSDRRTELYREVRRMYHGESPELEEAWGVKGPFWARHYIFWAGSCPLCVIYEVFSPKLEQYLGGCEAGSGIPAVGGDGVVAAATAPPQFVVSPPNEKIMCRASSRREGEREKEMDVNASDEIAGLERGGGGSAAE